MLKLKCREVCYNKYTSLHFCLKNRRFVLNRIDENGRMNRYENAFLWLSDAGVALPSYNVTEPQPPLQLNEKRNLFKLFMGDTGLLCASCMDNIQFEFLQGNMEVNMGSVLENVFAQAVRSNGFSLNYFGNYSAPRLGYINFWSKQRKYNFCFIIALLRKVDNFSM